jgi:hypothetical protein
MYLVSKIAFDDVGFVNSTGHIDPHPRVYCGYDTLHITPTDADGYQYIHVFVTAVSVGGTNKEILRFISDLVHSESLSLLLVQPHVISMV